MKETSMTTIEDVIKDKAAGVEHIIMEVKTFQNLMKTVGIIKVQNTQLKKDRTQLFLLCITTLIALVVVTINNT